VKILNIIIAITENYNLKFTTTIYFFKIYNNNIYDNVDYYDVGVVHDAGLMMMSLFFMYFIFVVFMIFVLFQ
jgi:hypothetical protein